MCDPIPLCDDGFMGVWIGWVMSVGLILNIQTYKLLNFSLPQEKIGVT